MRSIAISALALALGSHAVAQDFTSPRGYLTRRGNDHQSRTLGYTGYTVVRHHLQIDDSGAGTPRPGIHTVSLRRANLLGYGPYVARSALVGVRMAHGDYGGVVHGASHEIDTLVRGGWTTVFEPKMINLPSWTGRTGYGAAPWSVQLLLDTPFDYDGNGALVWHMSSGSSSRRNSMYPMDAVALQQYGTAGVTYTGAGCLATGQTTNRMRESINSNTYGPGRPTPLYMSTTFGPPNANIWAIVGLSNPALEIGGCERLFASPDLVLPKNRTTASGYSRLDLLIPHQPSYVGVRLHVQSVAVDVAQGAVPFALSRGATTTYAAPPAFWLRVASGMTTMLDSAWPTTVQLNKGTGIIAGLSTGGQ